MYTYIRRERERESECVCAREREREREQGGVHDSNSSILVKSTLLVMSLKSTLAYVHCTFPGDQLPGFCTRYDAERRHHNVDNTRTYDKRNPHGWQTLLKTFAGSTNMRVDKKEAAAEAARHALAEQGRLAAEEAARLALAEQERQAAQDKARGDKIRPVVTRKLLKKLHVHIWH